MCVGIVEIRSRETAHFAAITGGLVREEVSTTARTSVEEQTRNSLVSAQFISSHCTHTCQQNDSVQRRCSWSNGKGDRLLVSAAVNGTREGRDSEQLQWSESGEMHGWGTTYRAQQLKSSPSKTKRAATGPAPV